MIRHQSVGAATAMHLLQNPEILAGGWRTQTRSFAVTYLFMSCADAHIRRLCRWQGGWKNSNQSRGSETVRGGETISARSALIMSFGSVV